MKLLEESKGDDQRKEVAFFDTIRLQRDQEIRQEQVRWRRPEGGGGRWLGV